MDFIEKVLASDHLVALCVVLVLVLLFVLRVIFGRPEEYGVASVTNKGEAVRSKAEMYIANMLSREGVKYVYEPTLTLYETSFLSFRTKTITPDFYLPDYDVYIEYWGLLGHPNYNRSMRFKMNLYKTNGVKLISIS